MRDQPDWTALPPSTPPGIRLLLRRCLEKDVRKRAPHVAVVRLAIEDGLTPTGELAARAPVAPGTARSRTLTVAAGAIAVLLALAAGYWAARQGSIAAAPPYRSTLLIDENINPRSPGQRFALSPDGRHLVYAAAENATPRVQLWMRSLDGLTSQALAGTDGASGPFWSPDSRFVAFFANGELRKIDVNGGPPVTITSFGSMNPAPDAPTQAVLGMPGTWNADGAILFSAGSRLARVPAAGGAPEFVTTLKAGETAHDYPYFLPDGRHFLFAAYNQIAPAGTYIGSLDGDPPVRLMNESSNAQFADGYLLFVRGTSLMAQPFDERQRTLSGEATPLAEYTLLSLTTRPGAAFSVSRTGVLVYGAAFGVLRESRVVWSTRAGVQTPLVDEPAAYRDLRLSPDGTRVSFVPLDDRGGSDLWVLDIARGVRSRLTFTGSTRSAAWSPDGKAMVFNGGQNQPALVRKEIDGSGSEQAGPGDQEAKTPFDWSRDGRTLLYETFSPQTTNDLWAIAMDGSGAPIPVATTRFSERWPQFSPDGRWIAYTSNESGAVQVYVTRFGGKGRWQVSAGGGTYPRWSRSGRELFFFTPNNKISAVEIHVVGDGIEAGPTIPLFDARAPAGFGRFFYDVAPDGRFLLSTPASNNTATSVTLVLNWPSILARR
jgi:Tol biopolymer transport system component